ncbi:DUF4835 family protein [Marivirga sp. S37H4]|uniref:DUF4835 family protein n=1 Tax=Marivirga aurantiaca TaxID=2802615 RepID=A0A935C8W1_9BACT|nr:DUF4835 family protein [Marivirga aurantiaca]MBK6263923.1 DUF4835 family protein [Marivirga aurantiaca]
MKKQIVILFLCFQAMASYSQDLFFEVKVDATTANTSETRVFTNMENSFRQFYNEKKWMEKDIELFERIKSVMVVNITDIPRTGRYAGQAQIQSVRPIYGSSFESVMINLADRNLRFDFTESQPLIYTPNSFNDNLVSILAFYANLLMGLDFDSYSELGGQQYFDEALNIARSAQQQNTGPGWEQFGSEDSRYVLIQSILNGQLEPVRQALYLYYRKGLDVMHKDPEAGRESILEALRNIQKANKLNPSARFIAVLIQTKSDEIVSIFSEGDINLRREAYQIMREIAPANSDKYEVMIK